MRCNRCRAIEFRCDFPAFQASSGILCRLFRRWKQEVPLSNRYVRGQRAILISVDGETATLQFPNGATLANVPLRDLVDANGRFQFTTTLWGGLDVGDFKVVEFIGRLQSP